MKKYYVSYLLLGEDGGIGAGHCELNTDKWTAEFIDKAHKFIRQYPGNEFLKPVIISWQELEH